MKWLVALFACAFVFISGVLVYLTQAGTSLRTAPLIKPTIITASPYNVPEHVFLRLFPEFQRTNIWVIGLDNSQSSEIEFLTKLQQKAESAFKKQLIILPEQAALTVDIATTCQNSCWILTTKNNAASISQSPLHEAIKGKSYLTLSLRNFTRSLRPSETCLKAQIIPLECMDSLAYQEVKKKLEREAQPQFFARKYLDKDYFIFIETNP